MTKHGKNLDDLIWRGSQISASGKLFCHSDLKTKLKLLDQRWQASQTKVKQRLISLKSAQDALTEKELGLVEVRNELDAILQCVHEEELSKDRTKDSLETFAKRYEVCKLLAL